MEEIVNKGINNYQGNILAMGGWGGVGETEAWEANYETEVRSR